MKKIILLGSGGFATEVMDTIEEINKYTDDKIYPLGYISDGSDTGKTICDIKVLGDDSYLNKVDLKEVYLIASVGNSVLRKKIVEKAKILGGKFLSIIHPTNSISKWTKIGEGAIIQSQCIFAGIDIEIGDFFVSNDNVSIGHGTKIGNYVHINPNVNIAGTTQIGNEVFIGVKATILPNKIGDRVVIGACALITKDVPSDTLAKGVPAQYTTLLKKKM